MEVLLLLVEALKVGAVLIADVEEILAQAKNEGWQKPLEPQIEAETAVIVDALKRG